MASRDPGGTGIEIGATLRDTRKKLGLDIRTVEEETKIRIKYLRALEAEEWDVLPSPAYVRGFLRTYGELLGLDAEVLVDEFRTREVGTVERSYPMTEPIITGRPQLGDGGGPPNRSGLAIGLAAALALVIGLLLLSGGDDGGEPGEGGGPGKRKGKGADDSEASPSGAVTLKLRAVSDLEGLCVINEERKVRFEGSLEAGEREKFDRSGLYLVQLESGSARMRIGGRAQEINTADPVSYEATGTGVRQIETAAGCG